MTSDPVKKAALLLREGATMLPETCPLCGSPLYKLKDGRIVCPVHGEIRKALSQMKAKEEGAPAPQPSEELKETIDDLIDALKFKLRLLVPKVESGRKAEAEELTLWIKALKEALEIKEKLEKR